MIRKKRFKHKVIHLLSPRKICEEEVGRKYGYWLHKGHGYVYSSLLDEEHVRGTEQLPKMKPSGIITTTTWPIYSLPKWNQEEKVLSETAGELERCFGDVIQRQIVFFKLNNLLMQLKESVGLENRGFLRVLNMCCDALQNVKSEKLKRKQVQTLKFVIKKLNENIDDFTATELEGILIDSGLRPTAKIEGIAELYE